MNSAHRLHQRKAENNGGGWIGAVLVIGGIGAIIYFTQHQAPPHLPPSPIPTTPKSLPPEYRTLAENLCLDIKPSPNQFHDNKGMAEILAEGHGAIMALRSIKSSDPDIAYIAGQAQAAFSECISHLQRINELPKPPDTGEFLVSSFIDGFFLNVAGAYQRGKDAEDKQSAIIVEAQALVAAAEKCDAAQQLLPKVAEKYSAPFTNSSGRIVVDFDEAWGSWGPHDWFSIYNSGSALQDCTVVVQLTGEQRQVRKNVHFIKNWPANTWMYARYEPGREILGRMVGNMSVTHVQQLDVTVYSRQFATVVKYVYQGAEKDKKIADKCKNLNLSGRYQPFTSGLWDTHRGIYLTLAGIPFIRKCRVDVTFSRGLQVTRDFQSKDLYWALESWKKGEEKAFVTQRGELAFDPDTIRVVISFPGTNYKYETSFAVRGGRLMPNTLQGLLQPLGADEK